MWLAPTKAAAYPSLQAFEALPDCYWYRLTYDASLLRWEHAPPPAPADGAGSLQAPQPPAQLLPADHPLLMVDLFSGLGTVSVAARAAGFTPVCGVECDSAAASSYTANVPEAGGPAWTLAQFLEALEAGEEGLPGASGRDGRLLTLRTAQRHQPQLSAAAALPSHLAEPWTVAYLHASPPCSALSSRNRLRSVERMQRELTPLLDQVGAGAAGCQCCLIASPTLAAHLAAPPACCLTGCCRWGALWSCCAPPTSPSRRCRRWGEQAPADAAAGSHARHR